MHKQSIKELPVMRGKKPITKMPKFLQQPMSNCYNGYMVNNNNTARHLEG